VSDRAGDWIVTQSGVRFYPLDPRPEDVKLQDVARALSQKARWGGHCSQFYSVCTHSLRVMAVAEQLAQRVSKDPLAVAMIGLYGLFHDGHEAYLADVPRPVKPFLHALVKRTWDTKATADDLDPWGDVEDAVDYAIFSAVGLMPLHQRAATLDPIPGLVKLADDLVLVLESRELFPASFSDRGVWSAMPKAEITDEIREAASMASLPLSTSCAYTAERFMLKARERIGLLGLKAAL